MSKSRQLPLDRSNSLANLVARIRTEHEATKAALNSAVVHAMAAGDLLIEGKAQVPHGQWLPWFNKHCTMSERSSQLYMKLAKNRETIENAMIKSATSVADLTLNEAAALCVLAGRLERLIDFAKRADGASPEQLVDLCVAEGFGAIKDEGYDPFYGRSKAEMREWILFGLFIGDINCTHIEWLLQGGSDVEHEGQPSPFYPSPFQNVDRWLGPEGSSWRKTYGMGWRDPPPQCYEAWAKFKAEYANKTRQEIEDEILSIR